MTEGAPIRFDGQVAVVTGPGRGLGAAYARLLAVRGAAVIVHDAGVAPDGSGADPSVAVDQFQRLDVLIHNAGLVVFADVAATDLATWDHMINLGVHAPFHLVQGALPHMRRQRYGRIVLTTSGRAMRTDWAAPGLVAYSVGKMAQLGLMVGLAADVGDADIRVNAISPVAATRVLRRHAPELRPEHVAPGVAFLASAQCDVSGVVLRAAGGKFSTARWEVSEDVDCGPEPAEPEAIAARWREIAGPR